MCSVCIGIGVLRIHNTKFVTMYVFTRLLQPCLGSRVEMDFGKVSLTHREHRVYSVLNKLRVKSDGS